MSLGKKIAQNVAQPFSVKINALLLPGKKVAQKLGLHLQFLYNRSK
jgi:hypothetical protein